VLEWLENTQVAIWVRTELWGWPFVLTIHVLGTALTIGFIFIVSLRLLGLFALLPYTALQRLFPVIWIALGMQLVSGFLLWMTKPSQYDADVAFVLKSALVAAGIALTLGLYKTIAREAAAWESKGAASSPRAVGFVAVTLLVWSGVIIASRLIAHLGSI
jgi:hypothetical protein